MFRLVILATCILSLQASIVKTKINDGSKIIGGHPIEISEAPWSLSIFFNNETTYQHFCTGNILSPTAILSAAHCFVTDASILSVRVGSAIYNEGGQIIRISRYTIHQNYSDITYVDDIGVAFLSEAITIATTASITLPIQGQAVEDGSLAINTGWGRTGEFNVTTPKQLQSVEIEIINQEYCDERNNFLANVTDGMICAGLLEGGKGACTGDSGGPLTVNGVLIGISSWSNGCVRPTYPTVYTRIPSYVDWINSQLSSQKS